MAARAELVDVPPMQGDTLLVTYMRDVASVLQLRSLSTGVLVRELPMPGYGSVKEVCARQSLSEMYYSYESMTDPGSTYKCAFPPSLSSLNTLTICLRRILRYELSPMCPHVEACLVKSATVRHDPRTEAS